MQIKLRPIQLSDIKAYKTLIQPTQTYHDFNGPYFKKPTSQEIEKRIKKIKLSLQKKENPLPEKELIINKETEELIGEVNWYWKSQETNWLEIGIVIFNKNYWGKGLGSIALPLWINKIFKKFPQIIRIDLSTWSGNTRMIHLAEKIGLKKEAEYKKARIVNGEYFDSLSYGILKEDWTKKN